MIKRLLLALFIASTVGGAACLSQEAPSPNAGGEPGPLPGPLPVPGTGPDAVPALNGDLGASCGAPITGVLVPADQAEFEQLIAGSWLRCSATSVLGKTEHVALEFDGAGNWYMLFEGPSGALVRGASFGDFGTYEVIDTTDMNEPGAYQLNLHTAGRGTNMMHPQFSSDGLQWAASNMGVHYGSYARIGGESATTGPEPLVVPNGTPACGVPMTGLATLETEDAAAAALTGVWFRCSDATLFFGTLEAGFELAADGQWYKLYDDGTGGLVRGTAFGELGRWELVAKTSATTWQLNLQQAGSGTIIVQASLSADLLQLAGLTMEVAGATYARAVSTE